MAAVARSACAPISKPERGRVGAHQLVDAVRRDRLVEFAGRVVAHRPEQRAMFIVAVSGGGEVIVNERLRAGMQRQITRLAAFAGHAEMRHAFARVLGVLDLQLAQLLAPQRMEQQRGQDGAVAFVAWLSSASDKRP